MIISHRHKFIFIKTKKTAGTSIEIALSKFLGPEDIITPISIEDERIRNSLGYRSPQNYHAPLHDYKVRDIIKFSLGKGRKRKFYNHISALKIKELVSSEVWGSYYKFAFTRNPYDRLISLYYWLYQEEPRPTISQFLDTKKAQNMISGGVDLYTIDGELAVDKICKYEDINSELEKVRKYLELPEAIELPFAKSTQRVDKRHHRDVLSHEDAMRIEKLCKREIELFGYRL